MYGRSGLSTAVAAVFLDRAESDAVFKLSTETPMNEYLRTLNRLAKWRAVFAGRWLDYLQAALEKQFPGFKATDEGIHIDTATAVETTKGWRK